MFFNGIKLFVIGKQFIYEIMPPSDQGMAQRIAYLFKIHACNIKIYKIYINLCVYTYMYIIFYIATFGWLHTQYPQQERSQKIALVWAWSWCHGIEMPLTFVVYKNRDYLNCTMRVTPISMVNRKVRVLKGNARLKDTQAWAEVLQKTW